MSTPRTADQLTDEELASIGFRDSARARRLLIGLAGRGVTDDDVAELLPSLLEALAGCPDPDRSLTNFSRWAEALVNKATHFRYLRGHPAGVRILIHIGATSQFLSDILARDPEYAELLANPSVRRGVKPADELHRELSALLGCITQRDLKLDAMRRFRQREVLRIASRDLLGLADMPTTARDFSNLADVCIQHCLELARQTLEERKGSLADVDLAVIALGKLGGRELNYSSDIDIVFACTDTDNPRELEAATRLAELVIGYLSRDTVHGHLFRVDVRLRPEGRFGALVRTLSSYRAYYENWAEMWERQAMIKARFVAGDAQLGERFMEMILPFAYPRVLSAAMIADIRQNKQRMEQSLRGFGSGRHNVKTGVGGIRDVEFTVQLLQMLYGARDPLIRTPSTLDAIARLQQAGYLSKDDAQALARGYIFLRNVEHRLQLLYDRQTQELPSSDRDLELLGRRLGYANLQDFLTAYETITGKVREVHERLFRTDDARDLQDGCQWTELLTELEHAALSRSDGEQVEKSAVGDMLREAGFRSPAQVFALLKSALVGTAYGRETPESVEAFRRLAPSLLSQCVRSPDPDAALHGLSLLAEVAPNRASWYQVLHESPTVLQRLVRLAAGSRVLIHTVARNPEWIDLLFSEEIVNPDTKPRDEFLEELEARVASGCHDDERFLQTVARYVLRERLRIGARDLWGETSGSGIATELTHLAEAVVQVLVGYAAAQVATEESVEPDLLTDNLVVLGLGKLGGRELSYYSDLDVMFVGADEPRRSTPPSSNKSWLEIASRTAERLLELTRQLKRYGVPFDLDARLRPEGRFGPLVSSLSQLATYFTERAELWERQAFLKARVITERSQLAGALEQLLTDFVYGRPLTGQDVQDILHMKRRIQTERLGSDEQRTNIKLGHGGMLDIEFLAQVWQLLLGHAKPELRQQRTTDALDALARTGVLPRPDAQRLSRTYRYYLRLRSRIALAAGQPVDTLPRDPWRARAVAIGLGAADTSEDRAENLFRARFEERMSETKRICERLFAQAGTVAGTQP